MLRLFLYFFLTYNIICKHYLVETEGELCCTKLEQVQLVTINQNYLDGEIKEKAKGNRETGSYYSIGKDGHAG